jgi:hypothetical protein
VCEPAGHSGAWFGGSIDGRASPGMPLGDQRTHRWDEFHGDLHRGMGGRLIGGLIFSDRFAI